MKMVNEVWVVDDDQSIRWVLEKTLSKHEKEARVFESAEDALRALEDNSPRVLITDIRMPGMSGIDLLAKLKVEHPNLPVVIMTAFSDLDSAVSAYEGGAFEYLPKPFDISEAMDIIERAYEASQTGSVEEVSDTLLSETPEIIGEAPAMQEVFRAIGRLMRSDVTVLVTGESGTGKELVAQALHRHSMRKDNPFIALNMAAIPKDLMESELFGHEKGAFTGANAQRKGRFEQADGGTLFLDEIGDMPADLQTRLLRVLADGEFYRIGGHTPVRANVRIIAATHQDLLKRVESKEFREDLYHRLNVIRIKLPALRERTEDIPLLAQNFLGKVAQELGVEKKTLTEEAEQHIMKLAWPGNVRELENTCRWLTVMCHSREVYVRDLPEELQTASTTGNSESSTANTDWQTSLYLWLQQQLSQGKEDDVKKVVEQTERTLINTALEFTGGRKIEAANLLGWGRNTLTRKLQTYDIEVK